MTVCVCEYWIPTNSAVNWFEKFLTNPHVFLILWNMLVMSSCSAMVEWKGGERRSVEENGDWWRPENLNPKPNVSNLLKDNEKIPADSANFRLTVITQPAKQLSWASATIYFYLFIFILWNNGSNSITFCISIIHWERCGRYFTSKIGYQKDNSLLPWHKKVTVRSSIITSCQWVLSKIDIETKKRQQRLDSGTDWFNRKAENRMRKLKRVRKRA